MAGAGSAATMRLYPTASFMGADAPAEGALLMLDLGEHRVGLYRVEGTLHALADRCPHRGAPLCAGRIATPVEAGADGLELGRPHSIVRCPWHKWEFDITTGRSLVDANSGCGGTRFASTATRSS